MKFELSDSEVEKIVNRLAERLIPKQVTPQPENGLNNWVRAESLYEKKLFSKATLNKYYKQGLIGKSTIGGLVCYYVPDILGLLERHHIRKEEVSRISSQLRKAS